MNYTKTAGKIDTIYVGGSKQRIRFDPPAKLVVSVEGGVTYVVLPFDQEKPEPNLLILSRDGEELVRLKALSPFGHVLDVYEESGEIKIFETSHRGQRRSRIDLDELKLIPDGHWR